MFNTIYTASTRRIRYTLAPSLKTNNQRQGSSIVIVWGCGMLCVTQESHSPCDNDHSSERSSYGIRQVYALSDAWRLSLRILPTC